MTSRLHVDTSPRPAFVETSASGADAGAGREATEGTA